MTVFYWIAGAALVAILGVVGWAMTLPEEASASRTTVIKAPVDAVFGLVTGIADQPSWRSDIGRVEVADDGMTWTEHTGRGFEIGFRQEEKRPGLYVISFASPRGFSGRWEGRFEDEAGSTRVNITESVRTEGLVARAMGRLFAPAGAHIDLYLADLKRAAEK